MSDVTIRLTPEGATELVNALKRVQRELKGTGDAAAESGRKTKESANSASALADSAAKASLKIAGAGTALHLAGSTLTSFAGKSNDTAAALGQLATQAGTLVSAFATGGPWGLALAAGTQALGALVALLDQGSESAGKFTDRLTTLIGELDRIAERRAILEAFAPRVAAADRARRLVRGQQTAADIVSGIGVGAASAEDIAAAQAAADELQREQAEKRKALIRSQQPRRRRGRPDLSGDFAELGAIGDAARARGGTQLGTISVEQLDAEAEQIRGVRGQGGTIAESLQGLDRAQQTLASLGDSLERIRKMNDPFERMKKGAEEAGQAIVENIGESATSALQANVDAWLSGEESITQAAANIAKEVIKSVISQSIIKAIFETGEGIAAAAGYRYAEAAQHFAAAGVYAAVGVAAGGLGLAVGAVGGGGGGAAPSSSTPARPETSRRDRDRDREPPVVINVYALEPTAEVGRKIHQATRMARRVYGEAAA